MIHALFDDVPDLHPSAWVAPTAAVIGKVVLAAHSSVWFGATNNSWVSPLILSSIARFINLSPM